MRCEVTIVRVDSSEAISHFMTPGWFATLGPVSHVEALLDALDLNNPGIEVAVCLPGVTAEFDRRSETDRFARILELYRQAERRFLVLKGEKL